jgi:isopenicillin-N N-acyltransferase-like protein
VNPHRYRHIEVSGNNFEMGQQIGDYLKEELQGFVATSWDRIAETLKLRRETILHVIHQSTQFVRNWAPDLLDELSGATQSSGLSFDDLMFLQIRNQLTADMDSGCTSFSLRNEQQQISLIGQNWDNDPALDPFTVVLTRRPCDKPAFMTVTQAGLIAYIGMSDAGMAACLNSLPAPARTVGVPHYFTLRRVFEGRTLDHAVNVIARATRAIPANIMLSTPDGPANLEVTIDAVNVLRPATDEVLLHTNHCLHPNLASINSKFPELIQSRPRLERMTELLQTGVSCVSVESLKTALQDHSGFPRSICRHANEDPGHGYWKTVFSVIMSVDAGEMYVARGNPCEASYEVYRL